MNQVPVRIRFVLHETPPRRRRWRWWLLVPVVLDVLLWVLLIIGLWALYSML